MNYNCWRKRFCTSPLRVSRRSWSISLKRMQSDVTKLNWTDTV